MDTGTQENAAVDSSHSLNMHISAIGAKRLSFDGVTLTFRLPVGSARQAHSLR